MSMEPETRDFLVRIALSLSMGLLWLLVNSTVGIFMGYAFFDEAPQWYNYVYWVFLVGSFLALIFWYKKKWDL